MAPAALAVPAAADSVGAGVDGATLEWVPAAAAVPAPTAAAATPATLTIGAAATTGPRVADEQTRPAAIEYAQQPDSEVGAGGLAGFVRYRQRIRRFPQVLQLDEMDCGAESLGLAVRTAKVSKSRLDTMPLPAIVHWENNHWLVLYDVNAEHARVSDPARGRRKLVSPVVLYCPSCTQPTVAAAGQPARSTFMPTNVDTSRTFSASVSSPGNSRT